MRTRRALLVIRQQIRDTPEAEVRQGWKSADRESGSDARVCRNS